jgi:glucose-6-phosphate isomerase
MTRPVVLDATGLVAAAARGPGDAGFAAQAAAARAAHAAIMARRAAGELGFWDLPDDRATARACLDYAAALDPAIDTMVVLGIGGSSLGPRAAYTALAPAWDPIRPRSPGMPRRLFFPDNVDPATFGALVDLLPPERTVWNIVTKSGGTAETCAQLAVVADRLERALGAERAARHLVATTDPAKGALRALATARGWATFAVPPNVGGRFSVLTPVGLLPAAVAGLDVMGLIDGARAMRDRCVAPDPATNPALALASLLHHHHTVAGRPMVVMMAYVDALYDTADWFRQLWAESLGKAHATDGRVVHVGPTPIAARGATDQHSQLQLYAEGPDDKTYVFLTVDDRGPDVRIPDTELARGTPELAYLAGKGMGALLDAELLGTRSSLASRGRPVATIRLARASAEALGALFVLLEAATAFAGPLYGVDPFDQPGVEEAKRLTFAAFGRPGFEGLKDQIAAPAVEGPYVL